MPTYPLAETVLLEGPDAGAFAQAQFSSNVSLLATNHWQFSAWLNPQGRVRGLFHLARLADDRYLMLLRGGSAAPLAEALRGFLFRSKLSVTALSPRTLHTGAAVPLHAIDNDNDTLALGCGTHSLHIAQADHDVDHDHSWRLAQLRLGWPWLAASSLNAWLPATLSLQRLQAVAIDKGCYPGQEIVARLHFRGGQKRHLHGGRLSRPATPGDVLRIDEREVGCVVDVVETDERIEALIALNDDVAGVLDAPSAHAFDHDLTLHLDASWPA